MVATDKTSRFCVTSNAEMSNRTENILQDNSTYKMLKNSKKVALEKQANKLIDNVYKNKLSKSNLQRLHSTGSQPANFYALIKDHKDKCDDFFPLRPIASVHSTPTNKIDWICGRILNQLVQYVPAHLPSSSALIEDFKNLTNCNVGTDSVFVSLDVVNLYPSVSIPSALKVVSDFARDHWSKIDNLNMSEEQFLKLLTFVSYNYEIQYNNKVYLQIKGCPMGSHYAPPFAIIFMNYVENKALTLLRSEFDCIQNNSTLYKRYIDDSIFGPFKRDQAFFDRIIEIFNSIDENIKFTLESPSNGCLNFLDLSIWTENNKIVHKIYKKDLSTGLSLAKQSWLPSFVKTNFVQQSVERVRSRCSASLSHEDKDRCMNMCFDNLVKNGYSAVEISNALKINNKNKNKKTVVLVLISRF